MNLDHLHKVNQRAQEIARVAGSQINRSTAETYGHEIEQLVEEGLTESTLNIVEDLFSVVRCIMRTLVTLKCNLGSKERKLSHLTRQWLVMMA